MQGDNQKSCQSCSSALDGLPSRIASDDHSLILAARWLEASVPLHIVDETMSLPTTILRGSTLVAT